MAKPIVQHAVSADKTHLSNIPDYECLLTLNSADSSCGPRFCTKHFMQDWPRSKKKV
jgi:hypothetical protein